MKLTIGWLYPDLMSTYGDRGNIICLTKRCQWRKIDVTIKEIFLDTKPFELQSVDLLFAGGAQDRQQKIIEKDLRISKGKIIKELIEKEIPGLYICAAYQLFGHSYQPAEGETLEGLHIFDVETKHFGKDKPRCIGNIVAELPEEFFTEIHPRGVMASSANWRIQPATPGVVHRTIVGFENHGGRTYLGKGVKALAKVITGYGNNGEDGTDGFRYKNAIGNYFHGPILPKNPHLADWLISCALEVKYKKEIELQPLDDALEWQAHRAMLRRLKIHYITEVSRGIHLGGVQNQNEEKSEWTGKERIAR